MMIGTQPLVLGRMPLRDHARWPMATSWFGGRPRLAQAPWPRAKRSGYPLHFLAQIDLGEVSRLRPGAGLPRQGSLAFFVATDGDEAQVVFVPDHMSHAPAAPPEGTPLIFGKHYESRFPGAASTATAPRSFRQWPMRLVPIGLPPGLEPQEAEHRAHEAIPGLGVTRNGFSVRSAAEMLPHDDWPYFWHSAQLLLGSLLRSLDRMEDTRQERNALLEHALTWRAKIESDPLSPEAREAAARRADEVVARERGELARLDGSAQPFVDFVQQFKAWVGARAPTEVMTDQQIGHFQQHFYKARHQLGRWYKGYSNTEEIASETLRFLLVSAPHVLPQVARDHVDRVHLLPARGRYHVPPGTGSVPCHVRPAGPDPELRRQER